MPDDTKITLISGLFPGAIVALASIAFVYSIWVAIVVAVGSFVIVNGGILLYYKLRWLDA